ncbi:Nn.00g092560.m01.CDS01 [Neocucurbitaria sp. VM-36]
MGGHAFKDLYCPRIAPEFYNQVKSRLTTSLHTIFAHVVVPTEMPGKDDYGDVDFLVSGPFHSPTSTTIDNFDWKGTIHAIKAAFNTLHGRRGFLNPDCMYFAIAAPNPQDDYFIQVDVKVCFNPDLFVWTTFELNYASNSKVIGSMVKPLGLTIDPKGLHIRVEEMEETNFPGSMIWVSKKPKDVLKIVGLDRRIINAGFKKTTEEIYKYFADSWLFNPAHFAARLAEEKYFDRLEDRSPHWTYFVKEWIPRHYPGGKSLDETITPEATQAPDKQSNELQVWYKRTRGAVRERVFTTFPHIATEYYIKRAAYVKELEEQKLRHLISKAIPTGGEGWKDDFQQPKIFIKRPGLMTPLLTPMRDSELTPPPTPASPICQDLNPELALPEIPSTTNQYCAPITHTSEPWDVPLCLDPLPRVPPLTCTPHPPPANMSLEAKLNCLARWTRFDPSTGAPFLLFTPHSKDFEMHWTDATYAGATEEFLTKWAGDMWWHIWIRQSHVNYVGMWKKRFEKADKLAYKMRMEEEATAKAEKLMKVASEKITRRLKALNVSLGLVDAGDVAHDGEEA